MTTCITRDKQGRITAVELDVNSTHAINPSVWVSSYGAAVVPVSSDPEPTPKRVRCAYCGRPNRRKREKCKSCNAPLGE